MTTKPVILAVDLSNQIYRALHSHPELTHEGEFTGGAYGFLSQVATALHHTRATRIVLCKDCKPYLRSKVYPEYKKLKRVPPDPAVQEAYKTSEAQIMRIAEESGLPVWAVPGFEADDLAGALVKWRRHRYSKIWSMSNDTDLDQLLWCPNFSRIAGTVKQGKVAVPKIVTLDSFHKDNKGLDPRQVPLRLALCGTHNDVEGIPKVGDVRSLEAVTTHPQKLEEFRRTHGQLIDRNIGLITLPHAEFPREHADPPVAEFDLRRLYRSCAALGITVTTPMSIAFSQLMVYRK